MKALAMIPDFPGLDTPCVLVDIDRVEANLARAQAHAQAKGLALRPHIKTHKLPRFALRQIELGAVGITCQKLGEAEVMADAGVADILLPYNILGEAKLTRMRTLAERIRLTVSADSATVLEGYAGTFAGASRPLGVFVECDTGMGRCGVGSPEAAVELAAAIAKAPGLAFAGLVTYPAAGGRDAARRWLEAAVASLAGAGLTPAVVSSGGTPDLWAADRGGGVTEYRPGTYIYLDRFQVGRGVGTLDDCALTVLATVVSRPTPERAVIDAGSKSLTSDTLGLAGFGYVVGHPDAVIASLSEEHGVIELGAPAAEPAVGDRLRIVPNHACVVSNLFDTVELVAGGRYLETLPVAARGKVR